MSLKSHDPKDPQYTAESAKVAENHLVQAVKWAGEASKSGYDRRRMDVSAAWSSLEDELIALLAKARSLPR